MRSFPSAEFPSKRDAWFVAVLSGVSVIEVAVAAVVAVVAPLPIVVAVAVAVVLLFSAALIAWCLVSTSYRVQNADLAIRCGPFRWRIPISAIRRVVARRGAIAAPALSWDRLALEYATPPRVCEVSPDRPEAFVAALVAVNPNIAFEGIADQE